MFQFVRSLLLFLVSYLLKLYGSLVLCLCFHSPYFFVYYTFIYLIPRFPLNTLFEKFIYDYSGQQDSNPHSFIPKTNVLPVTPYPALWERDSNPRHSAHETDKLPLLHPTPNNYCASFTLLLLRFFFLK
jgi:hypothetical protein